jgi:hypothetical protein
LHVTQWHSGVERGSDETVTQRVRTDPLVDPGSFGQSAHDPSGSVTIEPGGVVVVQEDRATRSFTDVEIHGSGGSWCQRDSGGLVALAMDEQRPVAAG